MNNWQDIDSCFGTPPETLSTRCGQGVTIFYGMAKPVRAPQIGPAHAQSGNLRAVQLLLATRRL